MLGIGNMVTAGSKVANVVRRGLQAWYKADETQAPLGGVKDFSPNTNDGVLYSGKALHFAQANDYIDIDYWKSEAISVSTKATFAVWFNSEDVGYGGFIFGTAITADWFYLATKSAKLDLGWNDSEWGDDVTSGALPSVANDTWYRAVAVVDGLTCSVYLNGEFVFSKTATSSFTLDDNGVYIGSQGDVASSIWYGKLSDFQIYDKAWTASDVTYDYNNPDKDVFDNSNSSIETTDCKALYRLNEGAGDRVYNAAPVLGEDLTKDYHFKNEWQILDDTKADDANTFTTYQASGIYKSNVTVGSTYKVTIAGTVSTSSGNGLEFRNASNSDVYHTISSDGEFSSTFVFKATHVQTYLKNNSAGTTTITTLKLQEISLSNSHIQASWVSDNWKTAQPYIPQYAMSSYSKKALFDGAADEYVDCGTGLNDVLDDGFTVSCWFSVNTFEDYKNLFDLRNNTSPEEGFEFRMMANGTMQALFDWGSSVNIPTPTLDVGQLYHVVATIDKSTSTGFKLYLDGVLVDEKDISDADGVDTTCDDTLRFMKDFDGFGDEISVFKKVLSVTEVQEIFNAGMALDCRDHSAFLGSEIVNDGGFDDANKWSPNTGWTVSGGKASVNATDTALRQVLSVTQGKIYDLTFEISDYVKGAFQFGFNQFNIAGTSDNLDNFSENGVYNYRVVALGDDIQVYMYGVNASEFSIDNLSLREVQLNGYWRNNGVDTWVDLSPYGNDGTVNGSPTTIQLQEVPYFKKDTFGLPMNKVRQKGLNFDGDSYVTVDDDNDFNMSSGFSTSFWVNCRDVNTRQWLVTKGTAVNNHASDKGFGTTIFKPDGLYPRVYASINTDVNRYQVHTTEAIVENDWLYVTVTYALDTSLKLYINENLISSVTPDGTVDETRDLHIGDNYELNTGYRSSSIVDDVKWYNRPLELSEIKKNYKATKSQHKNNTVSNWSDDFDSSFI